MSLLLTDADYAACARRFISREIAAAAGIRRVCSLDGRDVAGRKGGGDYAGIVFDYRRPGQPDVVLQRIRLDSPPLGLNGKAEHKYLSPPGARNHVYFPPCTPELLNDLSIPVLVVEGEFKTLACWRAAFESGGNGGGKPLFLPVGLGGVYGWRSIVGTGINANGERVPVKGLIPDLQSFISWPGRKALLGFDANAATNPMVQAGRAGLARELTALGAKVHYVNLPQSPGVNGPDDFLAIHGIEAYLNLIRTAQRYHWHDELARSDKGRILASFGNALAALRLAPEWHGVLGWNEFKLAPEARRDTPWSDPPGRWSDYHDFRTMEWLEHQGIRLGHAQVSDAVMTVMQESPFHPVRDYLDGLKWDGESRIHTWLGAYLGAEINDYTKAIGSRWLISGVARIRQPGCKADHMLILEGPQGAGKSSAIKILAGDYYNDDISDLGSKDAAMSLAGAWVHEEPELAAIGRSESEKQKAFTSRCVDRYRPPYARHVIDVPRQCIFCGTINLKTYLKDETGGRRFWVVRCGRIDLTGLARYRDQLWAEAQVRYDDGDTWWLDTETLVEKAAEEQEDRFSTDPWEPLITAWLLDHNEVTTSQALQEAIRKDSGHWTRADEIRVGIILNRLGWEVAKRVRVGGVRKRVYTQKNE